MLTSEDVSLFWDRFTTWLFSQRAETVMLVGLICFLCWMLLKQMDENSALQHKIIEMSKERLQTQ